MEILGGMSGGAVVNADGYLVGILSSSLDGGPSFVTLIWEAMRLDVKGTIPKLSTYDRVSLLAARERNAAKIKGSIRRNPFGDVIFSLPDAEAELFRNSLSIITIESARTPYPSGRDRLVRRG